MNMKSKIAVAILILLFVILFVGPNVPVLHPYVNPAGAALVVITVFRAIALIVDQPSLK